MSRTAITLKFKMFLFSDEASYWAEKLLRDINLPLLCLTRIKTLVALQFWILESDDVTCNPRIELDKIEGRRLVSGGKNAEDKKMRMFN